MQYEMAKEKNGFFFERQSVRGARRLSFDNEKCVGCRMCASVCPVDAIVIGPVGAITKGVSDNFKVRIDSGKCTLCGMCSGVCMFDSLNVTLEGEPLENAPGYVKYERLHVFNQEKCKMKDQEAGVVCKDCQEMCPTGAIEAFLVEEDGKTINTINRDENLCIFCSTCQNVCPQDAIEVKKAFEGESLVDQDKCQGCGSCVEVCPTNAVAMPKGGSPWERTEKVFISDKTCIYCGACGQVCPVDAITIKRTKVNYHKDQEKSWTNSWENTFKSLVGE